MMVPEAMRLITNISIHNKAEGNLYQLRKQGTAKTFVNNDQADLCKHEDQIDNWKCTACQANISKFNICFDDNQGKVNTFTQIVYENSFLQDFKEDFKQQASVIVSSKKTPSVLIYQAY